MLLPTYFFKTEPMKCLIVDELHNSIHELMESIGLEYDYLPELDREGIKTKIQHYDGLMIRSKTRVDNDLLENAENLKFVARAGAGVDNLDENLLNERGITIINAPEGNRDSVGEHTLGLILGLLHNLHKSSAEVLAGIWDREGNRGEELRYKTVGLIGYGNMGKATAKRLKPMGCRVIAYDKYLISYGDEFAEQVTLDELFEETDILSLHIPLTPETNGMVSTSFLKNFTKEIILVNTARGEIVPLQAITDSLTSGKIKKAALDVLQNEKLTSLSDEELKLFNNLRGSGKVIFSPHVAGWSFESYEKINQVMVKKLEQFLEKFN